MESRALNTCMIGYAHKYLLYVSVTGKSSEMEVCVLLVYFSVHYEQFH